MKVLHKVITAKDGKDLETQMNKWSKEQWIPSCNPLQLGDGRLMIVMSKQEMLKPKTNPNIN